MSIRSLCTTSMLAGIFLAALCLGAAPAHAGKKATGKGPCKNAGKCKEGVCVEINGDSYCSKTCGGCPGGMYCDDKLFGMAGMKVCVKGAAEKPVQPKEPPRMPCKKDKHCNGDLVCAKFMGEKGCTRTCGQPSECQMPEIMGIKMDFMSCQQDQRKSQDRMACLPKKECLADPSRCISMNAAPMANMMGKMQGFGMGVAAGMEGNSGASAHVQGSAGASASVSGSSSGGMGMGMDMGGGQPAPAQVQAGHSAMDRSRFKKLLKQVKSAGFDDERMGILKSAAKRNWFTCDQLGQIIDILGFDDERVGAVRIIAPKLVDKENSHEVLSHMKFDDEREAAQKILDE